MIGVFVWPGGHTVNEILSLCNEYPDEIQRSRAGEILILINERYEWVDPTGCDKDFEDYGLRPL